MKFIRYSTPTGMRVGQIIHRTATGYVVNVDDQRVSVPFGLVAFDQHGTDSSNRGPISPVTGERVW